MQPIWLIFKGSAIWSLSDPLSLRENLLWKAFPFPSYFQTQKTAVLLLAALCPESNSCHLSCSPDHLCPVSCSLWRKNAGAAALHTTHWGLRHLLCVTEGYHWHWGGSAFNSHFQNQLCHLSWQMAFPGFGLSEAEKSIIAVCNAWY